MTTVRTITVLSVEMQQFKLAVEFRDGLSCLRKKLARNKNTCNSIIQKRSNRATAIHQLFFYSSLNDILYGITPFQKDIRFYNSPYRMS